LQVGTKLLDIGKEISCRRIWQQWQLDWTWP